ncbi:MAG: hypothetical protein R3Y50_02875 [Rikenellaceae bacterium]
MQFLDQNNSSKIGTAFTVNDDALASKIDNAIAANSTDKYTSVFDTSSTNNFEIKVPDSLVNPTISGLGNKSQVDSTNNNEVFASKEDNSKNRYASVFDTSSTSNFGIKMPNFTSYNSLSSDENNDNFGNNKKISNFTIDNTNSLRDNILEYSRNSANSLFQNIKNSNEKSTNDQSRLYKYNQDLQNVSINFAKPNDRNYVSEKSLDIIRKIAVDSNCNTILITSTVRTPREQALQFYNDDISKGFSEQYNLYSNYGDEVIKIHENNQSLPKEEIINLMTKKINDLIPSNVSKHCGDHNQLNVFDIAYSSLGVNRLSFIDQAKKLTGTLISKLIDEPKHKCVHIEIEQ